MKTRLDFDIRAQPDDLTCGPTCLHSVYRFFGDEIALDTVIDEVQQVDRGGTIAVFLAQHALKRGYEATIYTYNLTTFDPTWFQAPGIDISERLRLQARAKQDRPLRRATEGYLDFLALGGQLRFEDLTTGLLRRHLKAGLPVLTGLSATYLYRCAREYGPKDDADDVRGAPAGHFVVLAGYDSVSRTIQVADPYLDNPLANGHHYTVPIERVVGSILLGVLTYDANLLVLRPKQRGQTTRKTGGPPGQ